MPFSFSPSKGQPGGLKQVYFATIKDTQKFYSACLKEMLYFWILFNWSEPKSFILIIAVILNLSFLQGFHIDSFSISKLQLS